MKDPKITEISSKVDFGHATITAKFDDGTEGTLFSYYIDELSFRDAELIGLTKQEAGQLRLKKDVAYLQS
tara:strand:- start:90 stop:299 length:210 start_codon:yes stop_codon:yes gene_type:complete